MRDLEIRGAGNLLGDEQSGHVAALGFELYLAMLDEAVRGMDGTLGDDEPEPVRLDVNVDAYVPADYVPYEQAKVDVHRRVAAARDVADLALLRDELEDRFGPVPEPLENLIALQQARIKFGRAGARMVSFRGEMLAATPLELTSDQAQELRERVPEAALRARPQPGQLPRPARRRSALSHRGGRRGCAAGGHRARGGPDSSLTNRGYHDPFLSCPLPRNDGLEDSNRTSSRGPARWSPSSASPPAVAAACPATRSPPSAIRRSSATPSTTG